MKRTTFASRAPGWPRHAFHAAGGSGGISSSASAASVSASSGVSARYGASGGAPRYSTSRAPKKPAPAPTDAVAPRKNVRREMPI